VLSLAWEGIFKAALGALDGVRGLAGIREAADWCVTRQDFASALEELNRRSFGDMFERMRRSLPPIGALRAPSHELAL